MPKSKALLRETVNNLKTIMGPGSFCTQALITEEVCNKLVMGQFTFSAYKPITNGREARKAWMLKKPMIAKNPLDSEPPSIISISVVY